MGKALNDFLTFYRFLRQLKKTIEKLLEQALEATENGIIFTYIIITISKCVLINRFKGFLSLSLCLFFHIYITKIIFHLLFFCDNFIVSNLYFVRVVSRSLYLTSVGVIATLLGWIVIICFSSFKCFLSKLA